MPIELKVPEVGESITEVQIGPWKKKEGDTVKLDETVVEIESDKATVELPAPASGTIVRILKAAGEQATVGEVIGLMEEGAGSGEHAVATPVVDVRRSESKTVIGSVQPAGGGPPPSAAVPPRVMPAASRVLAEAGVPEQGVQGTGPGGRVTKQDAISATVAQQSAATAAPSPVPRATAEVRVSLPAMSGNRQERPVVMSPIRRRIAERLVEAQHEAALLTTFNEVDMSAVMALRARYKDSFLKKHGVKLGFMSFFVKAAVEALREIPQVNAEFREPHIVYRDYCDIGIAVGGGKGLVVPVIRNAETLGFADIESTIADFAVRAADNKIKLEELQGGTFTISNGGVYGSLLSTPIINPPQSGILGLHAIQERPVAHEGQVVIRPMMYIALSYDHRLVDGREAVTFLKRIKETMEDPSRLLLEV
jgi:2-oxoglutarate dehydrogenase E2 component (dihydrolipoamide succinyltransferase)